MPHHCFEAKEPAFDGVTEPVQILVKLKFAISANLVDELRIIIVERWESQSLTSIPPWTAASVRGISGSLRLGEDAAWRFPDDLATT